MIEQLLQYDTELFLYLNNLGTTAWDGFWMFYTTKFNWIPFYVLLLYLMYKHLDKKTFLLTILVIVLMVSFTDQVTNLFKNGFKRLRPCHNQDLDGLMRLVKSYCGYKYGYFSGHSSNSMAVAFFVSFMLRKHYKYIFVIMIFWALLMGYSRIYIGVHYPLDVVCGATFGALSGFMFYKLDKYLQKRFVARND